MERMDDKLSSLWAQYRDACPDTEPGVNFMPQLWQKIEARRTVAASVLLRRWAEVWLVATVALAIVMGAFLIPRFQSAPGGSPTYQASYVDVLAAADSAADSTNDGGGELE
jgi:anti-sigma-K factor RskA